VSTPKQNYEKKVAPRVATLIDSKELRLRLPLRNVLERAPIKSLIYGLTHKKKAQKTNHLKNVTNVMKI
jgi:hypothetical protein